MLVRLLDIFEYGRYRQFMAVATWSRRWADSRSRANLNYLIARTLERAASDITKTSVLMAGVAFMSALMVVALRATGSCRPRSSPSWLLLAVYVFLFLNLEVLVSYWLAHGRSFPVMVYTLIVTAWRLGTLLAAVAYYDDVEMIFVTLVCAEAVKNLAIWTWPRARAAACSTGSTTCSASRCGWIAPLGLGSVLNKANDFGKVVSACSSASADGAVHH